MKNKRKLQYIYPITISLVLHILLLIIAIDINPQKKDYNEGQALKIKSIKRDYKTVGIKDGSKKNDIQAMQKSQAPSDPLDLSSLQVDQNIKVQQKQTISKKAKNNYVHKRDFSYFIKPKSKGELKKQKRFLKKISQERYLDPVLSNSDFALNPELPQGVKEDELNTAEKIFYGFKKRILEQYLASFVDKYQTTKKTNSKLKEKLISKKHRLSGRITFDKDGNIVTIKIIKSSEDDDIHMLFEETLKGINKVPNPPHDLLTKDNQFSIYYILQIN